MVYRVSPEQYANLVGARDNWPTRLAHGTGIPDPSEPGCTLVYLGVNAGLGKFDIISKKYPLHISLEARSRIYGVYGIPMEVQENFVRKNDAHQFIPLFSQQVRSVRMLRHFKRFISSAQIDCEMPAEVTRDVQGNLERQATSFQ